MCKRNKQKPSMYNYQSVLDQLQAAGLVVEGLQVDAGLVRCELKNSNKRQRGWYQLFSFAGDEGKTLIAGAYGYWQGNENNKQKVFFSKEITLSANKRKELQQKQREQDEQHRLQRKRDAERAAVRATKAWAHKCRREGQSDYLAAKGVRAHGVRFGRKGEVIVPIQDAATRIYGLQIIRPAGNSGLAKQYWPKGLVKKGRFFLIGTVDKVLLVAEGYATAATLHEATGLAVAVAFDAGNIEPVVAAVRKHYNQAQIVICADDDYVTEGNPGLSAAKKAANKHHCRYLIPDFVADGKDLRGGQKLTDFNDLAHLASKSVVKSQVMRQVRDLGVSAAASQPAQAATRQAVAVMSLDALVERYIYIDSFDGKSVFDSWTNDIVALSKVQSMLPKGCRWDDVKAHPDWQSKAVYMNQIGFDPSGEDSNIRCNTWHGWPTTPAASASYADAMPILGLLESLCVEEGDEVCDWVLKWLAYPIQHPGAKMKTALLFHGGQGTGKSLFFESYAKIYGKYSQVINQAAMEDAFNADWVDQKLFIVADEVVASADKYHVKNDIKTKITGETIRINKKMVEARTVRNYANFVFLSNEFVPVVLERDDRRFAVVWGGQKPPQRVLEDAIDYIKSGGIATLHAYLLGLDLGDFSPDSKPPVTKSKSNLIGMTLSPLETFVREWRGGELGLVRFGAAPCTALYELYKKWCQRAGERYPGSLRQFGGQIQKLGFSVTNPRTVRHGYKDARVRFYVPDDGLMAQATEAGAHLRGKKDGQTESDFWSSAWRYFPQECSSLFEDWGHVHE